MNIFKLNNLYNYLLDNYMNKESKELFLLIKNASKNFESDSSKFVYIINYLNSKYSIYYVGKSKFLFRRMAEHKIGLGPHILGKLTDHNWDKKISEILIFQKQDSSEFPDESLSSVEESIAKILNGAVNHNCGVEARNDFLTKTLLNIEKDFSDGKKVIILGGGIGELHVQDDYQYSGDIYFSTCQDVAEEYLRISEAKDSYNERQETFFNGNISENDRLYLSRLEENFSSHDVSFEHISEGTNSAKDGKDTSLLRKHFGPPTRDTKGHMFKIFQFGKPRYGEVDHPSIILKNLGSGDAIEDPEVNFLKRQIYNVLFNYMLHLRNSYRAILLINFAVSFGSVNIRRFNFFISTEEIKNEIMSMESKTINFILDNLNIIKNQNFNLIKRRGKLLKIINYLIINLNEDYIIKKLKNKIINNKTCNNYLKEEMQKVKSSNPDDVLEYAIDTLMKISTGKSYENFVNMSDESHFVFYKDLFSDRGSRKGGIKHGPRYAFLSNLKKLRRIKRGSSIPESEVLNMKNAAMAGLVYLIEYNYKYSVDSIDHILNSENIYFTISKKMKNINLGED